MKKAKMFVGDEVDRYIDLRDEMLSHYDAEWVASYARKIHGANYYDRFEAMGENMDLRYRGELGSIMDFAMMGGIMPIDAPFTQEQFQKYLEESYIPEAKAVYGRTNEWFMTALRDHASYIYEEIISMGGIIETAQYEGAEDKYRIFRITDAEGNPVCLVYYDPSAQVFDVVWMGV